VGIGISRGYATIGAIGYTGRRDYAAIGTVTNIAARLCAEADHGQILINQKVLADLEGRVHTDAVGQLQLKGIRDPLPAFNVVGLKIGKPEPVRLPRSSHY
jgi:class 3 adenylate cyclase